MLLFTIQNTLSLDPNLDLYGFCVRKKGRLKQKTAGTWEDTPGTWEDTAARHMGRHGRHMTRHRPAHDKTRRAQDDNEHARGRRPDQDPAWTLLARIPLWTLLDHSFEPLVEPFSCNEQLLGNNDIGIETGIIVVMQKWLVLTQK